MLFRRRTARSTAVWLLCSLLFRGVQARNFFYEGDENIVEAKAESGYFETSQNPRIVEFYNPYCGHCISFKSKFRSVVEQVQQQYPHTEAYGVSCIANSGLCRKYDIDGYPAIFVMPEYAPVQQWTELLPQQFTFEAVENILQQAHGDPFHTSVEPDLPGAAAAEQEDMLFQQEPAARPQPAMPERQLGRNIRPITVNEDPFRMEGNDSDVNAQSEPTFRRESDVGELNSADGDDDSTKDDDATRMVAPDEGYGMELPVEEGAHFAARQGSIPMAGAEAARGMERVMDQWKELHRQKRKHKHRVGFRKPKPPTEIARSGATQTMKAHQLNTPEFAERVAQIGKTLATIKGRKRSAAAVEKVRNNQKPYKKVLTKEKFAEKIPIVKMLPTIKMSAEEELILDASLSFLQGIRHGVFRSDAALSPARQHALFEFLSVMSVGLPPEWELHDTIDSLLANFDTIVQSAYNLATIMDLHPFPRKGWGPTCSRSSNPFTCGFWKLLHTMTVGIAEQRGGLEISDRHNRVAVSPLRAADAIRGYMENFFFCDECKQHFLERYDDCTVLRRCARLVASESAASDADWKELAKWLWEFHNIVSVDILRKNQRGIKVADEVKVIWPTLDGCFFCYNEDGTFNEEVVFLMLEKTYWPGHDLKETPRKLLSFDDDTEGVKFGVFLWLVCFAFVYAVSVLMKKKGVKGSIISAKTFSRKVMNIQHGGKTRVV